eukprot:3416862-Rhodomonas_salina.1
MRYLPTGLTPGMLLRTCYAMSGTGAGYAATHSLRTCYAMSGTGLPWAVGHVSMRYCMLVLHVQHHRMSVHREIKDKKPQFQYNLYQECAFWHLISQWTANVVGRPWYEGVEETEGGEKGRRKEGRHGGKSGTKKKEKKEEEEILPCFFFKEQQAGKKGRKHLACHRTLQKRHFSQQNGASLPPLQAKRKTGEKKTRKKGNKRGGARGDKEERWKTSRLSPK